MTKRARSITPPNVGKFATAVSDGAQPDNISVHPVKRTREDTKFLPRKIATHENAAKADKHPPFAQLAHMMAKTAKVAKGDAVVYWMRMQDMRGIYHSCTHLSSRLPGILVHDNRAFGQASDYARAAGLPLIALFVLSPQDYVAHDRSARRIDFTLRNLVHIQVSLFTLESSVNAADRCSRTRCGS